MNEEASGTSGRQDRPENENSESETSTDKGDGSFAIHYNFEEKVSKPKVSPDFNLPAGGGPVLEIAASFGYDSYRRNNLCVLNSNTLLFVAGGYIRMHSLSTKTDTFFRCTGGGSVSCLAVAKNLTVFASGERGHKPDVNIFGYPSCKLRKVLRNGTQKEYVSMVFEPTVGDLLATQGAEPDFNITVWHWVKEIPLLQCKSFSQEVYKVAFCEELFGNLVTSGLGHIRFWTMAVTFTGLKLKGQTGRFGTRDFSSIEAFIQFSDSKVLSGSEEGTLLLWDEALLKAEFCRKRAPNCHNGSINEILMYEDEVVTLGEDGYIRTWSFDEIVFVEPSYHGERFGINPLLEVEIGAQSSLMHMLQTNPQNPHCFDWYAQDRNGRVWSVDLSITMSSAPRVRLEYHGGPVLASAASPSAHLVATGGQDGMVRIFDCLQKKELLCMPFTAPVSSLIWMPLAMDREGASVIAGFDDGVVRTIAFCGKASQDPKENQKRSRLEGKLSQVFKPHKSRVTCFTFSHRGDIFVSGSSDKTIFMYRMKYARFEPKRWFSVPASVKQLACTPTHFVTQGFLAVCDDGIVLQISYKHLIYQQGITTNFENPNPKLRLYKFHSIKSEIRHAEEQGRPLGEGSRMKAESSGEKNEGSDEGEKDDEPPPIEDEEWEPFYPDSPSPIFQAVYSQRENYFWLTLGEYDAGYIYLCRFPDSDYNGEDADQFLIKPEKAVEVPDCCDVPITVMKINEASWQHLALLGFQNGHVRLVQLPPTKELDDLNAYCDLNAHDDKYGSLTGMEFAYDRCYLLTTGMDGNILMFSYTGLLEMNTKTISALPATARHHDTCSEDLPPDALWFVDQIKQEEEESKLTQAQASKKRRRDTLKELQNKLRSLIFQNNNLPPLHRLTREELLVNIHLEEEHRDKQQAKIAEIHRMYAWRSEKTRLGLEKTKNGFLLHEDLPNQFTVKAFNKAIQVRNIRMPFIWSEFEEILNASSLEETESFTKKEADESNETDQESVASSSDHLWQNVYSMTQRRSIGLTGTVARSLKMALEKASRSKKKRMQRKAEWDQLYEEKIKIEKDDPEELEKIKIAKNTIGNLKFKTDPSCAADMAHEHSQRSIFWSLAQLDRDCWIKVSEFNKKLMKLREEKMFVVRVFRALNEHFHQLSYGTRSFSTPPSLSEDEVPETKLLLDEQLFHGFSDEFKVLLDEVCPSDTVSSGKSQRKGNVTPENRKRDEKLSYFHRYYKGECSEIPEIVNFVSKQNVQEANEEDLNVDEIFVGQASQSDTTWSLRQEINLFSRSQLDFEEHLLKNFTGCLLDGFDCKLRNLRKERFELDVLLKQADLVYIARLDEFLIDKKTSVEEKEIAEVVTKKSQELKRNQAMSSQLRKQIARKSEDCEYISKQLSDLWLDFQNLCVEKSSSQMTRFLTALFKRRVYKRQREETDENEDELTGSDSASLLSESLASSSLSLDLNYCPDTIERSLYDRVVQMQRQRQALDEQQNELKQQVVLSTKELEYNAKEAETLKRAHDQAEHHLLTFFEEKIKLMNDIIVVVLLLESSIYSKVSKGLVLNRAALKRLHSRLRELKLDIRAQVNIMKDNSKKHVSLRRANRLLRERIDTWEKKCDEEVVKKFGKPVNMKILELITINPKVEMLRCHFLIDKDRHTSERKELDKEIKTLREAVRHTMTTTTNQYLAMADLAKEKVNLEMQLDMEARQMVTMDTESKQRLEKEERRELRKLVRQQAAVMHNCWREYDDLVYHGTSNLSLISRHCNVHRIPIIRRVPETVWARDHVQIPEMAAKARKPVGLYLPRQISWEKKRT